MWSTQTIRLPPPYLPCCWTADWWYLPQHASKHVLYHLWCSNISLIFHLRKTVYRQYRCRRPTYCCTYWFLIRLWALAKHIPLNECLDFIFARRSLLWIVDFESRIIVVALKCPIIYVDETNLFLNTMVLRYRVCLGMVFVGLSRHSRNLNPARLAISCHRSGNHTFWITKMSDNWILWSSSLKHANCTQFRIFCHVHLRKHFFICH